MTVYTEVKINGTDVAAEVSGRSYLLNWKVKHRKDNSIADQAIIMLDIAVKSVLTIAQNQSITIKRGDVTATDHNMFDGTITKISDAGGVLIVTARNPFFDLNGEFITYTYDSDVDAEAGKISALWESVVTGGDTFATATATDSGTAYILKKFLCNNDSRLERADFLRKLINWQHYYNYATSKPVFEPIGSTIYPTTLEVGTNVVNQPNWEENRESIINKVIIKGAVERDWNTEIFSGDAIETEFTLSKVPEDTEVYISGVLKVRGVEDLTTSFDYKVSKYRKLVIFESPPASASNNIEVNYSYSLGIPVIRKRATSISNYGLRTYRYESQDIQNVADAEKRAEKILDLFETPEVTTKLQVVDLYDIYVGYTVKVIDSANNKDGDYLVQGITYQWPETFDVVDIGNRATNEIDSAMNNIMQRIRDLERKLADNQSVSYQIDDQIQQINIHVSTLVKDAEKESGVLYWDDDDTSWSNDAGTVGDNWGDDSAEPETVVRIIHNGQIFFEDFLTETWKDSGNTTADWTANKLDMTTGEIAQSIVFALDNRAFTKVYLDYECLDNSLVAIYCSGDGGTTWDLLTSGEWTTLTSPTISGLAFKIISSGTVEFDQELGHYLEIYYE